MASISRIIETALAFVIGDELIKWKNRLFKTKTNVKLDDEDIDIIIKTKKHWDSLDKREKP
ncbi:MAG: hypothetical protein M0Q51_01295 [Bacteroidales bacterium]|nr:hypothetical protein [Bacteroidales bacterium]